MNRCNELRRKTDAVHQRDAALDRLHPRIERLQQLAAGETAWASDEQVVRDAAAVALAVLELRKARHGK